MFHNLHITLLMVPGVAVEALFSSQQLLAWLSISSVCFKHVSSCHDTPFPFFPFRVALPLPSTSLFSSTLSALIAHKWSERTDRLSSPHFLIYHQATSSLTSSPPPPDHLLSYIVLLFCHLERNLCSILRANSTRARLGEGAHICSSS